jgi:hypothetical protein
VPRVDEHELGVPSSIADPAAVVTYPVEDVPSIVRAAPGNGGLLVAGDGEGLVDLAAAGLLDGTRPVRYAASITTEAAWDDALSTSDALVLTDTNRRRARRWGTVRENTGYTEPANHVPLRDDPTDARLELFPTQTAADQTIAEQRGVELVRATRYGNPVSYTAEDRPANALDGDDATAWRVGAFADVQGERLRVDLEQPLVASTVTIVQPLTGPRNRVITKARLRFDGDRKHAIDVDLGPESLTAAGQTVSFERRRFKTLEVEVRATNAGRLPKYDGQSGVGIAELRIGDTDLVIDEVLRLPTTLLERAGDRAAAHPLAVVLTRQRSNPADPARADEEPTIKRTFALPAARPFTIHGSARLAPTLPDDAIDQALGTTSGVIARSDARLPGDLAARASAAIDGDPSTAWSPGLLDQVGHWLEVELPAPTTAFALALQVVADGRHSVPTRLRVEVDGDQAQFLELPPIADLPTRGAVVDVPVTFPPISGRTFRVTVEEVRPVTTPDFFSGAPLELPVAIAELGLAGAEATAPSPGAALDLPCRDDLLTVDGRPLPVRITGDVRAAASRHALSIEACGVSTALDLGAGDHEIRTAPGGVTGIDVDRLVLRSEPTAPATATALAGSAPRLGVQARGRTGFDVEVAASPASGAPFWLVLGQSHSLGWHATAGGRDLGPPVLVDGYANGWRIEPTGAPLDVRLRWEPQRRIWQGLAVSAAALLLCLFILLVSFLRSGRGSGGQAARIATETGGGPEVAAPARPHALAPLVVLVVFGLAAGPAVGVAAGVVTAAALVLRPVRWLLAFGAALALAAAGGYTALQQQRYGYPPDFAWPANFPLAHHLGWLSVALLAGTAGGGRSRPD